MLRGAPVCADLGSRAGMLAIRRDVVRSAQPVVVCYRRQTRSMIGHLGGGSFVCVVCAWARGACGRCAECRCLERAHAPAHLPGVCLFAACRPCLRSGWYPHACFVDLL
jgi:hypothetical protein